MVIETLQRYDWPGNVRQLQNVIERLVVESEGDVIEIDRVPPELLHVADATVPAHVSPRAIRRALKRHDNNITHAANALGLSRNQLYLRMQKLGIVVEKDRRGRH
jgi:transcriptional regulator of acetoin/glycerol metabolism